MSFETNSSSFSETSLVTESGYFIGAKLQLPISNIIKLEPAIIYSSVTDDTDINIEQLHIPINFLFNINKQYYINIGPQINFYRTDIPSDVEDFYNTTTFSGNLGFGYYFSENFTFDMNYNFQLNNFYKGGVENYEETTKYRYLNIGLSYYFNL